jgi:hypothetical protein
VNAETLALELARRMRDVVPVGIRVSAEGDMLRFGHGARPFSSGSYACQWLYQGDGPPADLLTTACWRALDDLQDFVDENTTEPWPGTRTPPEARTRIEDGAVLLWYGDPESPDLTHEPLPIDI